MEIDRGHGGVPVMREDMNGDWTIHDIRCRRSQAKDDMPQDASAEKERERTCEEARG